MRPADDKYIALINEFPLRPIRTAEENEHAILVISKLESRREQLSVDEAGFLEVLTSLSERYEKAESRAYSDK